MVGGAGVGAEGVGARVEVLRVDKVNVGYKTAVGGMNMEVGSVPMVQAAYQRSTANAHCNAQRWA